MTATSAKKTAADRAARPGEDSAPWERAAADDPFAAVETSAPEVRPGARNGTRPQAADTSELGKLWFSRASSTLLRTVLPEMTPDALRDALARDTGVESLVVGLREHLVLAAAEGQRERVERLLDLAEAQAAVLARAGGAVTAQEAGALLGGATRQAVEKRRERRGLLAVRVGGEYRYPICQFHDGDVLPGLPEVLRAFRVWSPWAALSILTAADPALEGRTAVQSLRDGDVAAVAAVVAVAEAHGDTGA